MRTDTETSYKHIAGRKDKSLMSNFSYVSFVKTWKCTLTVMKAYTEEHMLENTWTDLNHTEERTDSLEKGEKIVTS